MLKVEVTDSKIELSMVGDVYKICADISKVLSAVNEKLTENNPKLGHYFRVLFTKGYMDGICFEDDREHMNHYLAEGDEKWGKKKSESDDDDDDDSDNFAEFLCGFIDFLKDKRDELVKANELLKKKMAEENEDEAE